MTTQLIATLIVIAFLTTVPMVGAAAAALPSIEEQLQNAREGTQNTQTYDKALSDFQAMTERIKERAKQEVNITKEAQEARALFDRYWGGSDNNNTAEAKPNPYCDLVSDEYMAAGGVCHDRKDYSDLTGLYTCRDGTHEVHWEDCE